jgi:hypothetical protein
MLLLLLWPLTAFSKNENPSAPSLPRASRPDNSISALAVTGAGAEIPPAYIAKYPPLAPTKGGDCAVRAREPEPANVDGKANNESKNPVETPPISPWWNVVNTVGLIIVGGAQALLYYRQLKLTEQSIAISKDAAEASAMAAEIAARSIDKPAIFVHSLGVVIDPDADTIYRSHTPPSVKFNVGNYGSASAYLDEASVKIFVSADPPAIPPNSSAEKDEGMRELLRNPVIGAGEIRSSLMERIPETISGKPIKLTIRSWFEPELPEGQHLYFLVELRYRGAMTEGHFSRFCWMHRDGHFVPYGGKEFNRAE